MKTFKQYIVEQLCLDNISLVNEAWAEHKNYKRLLNDMFDAYEKRKSKAPRKSRGGWQDDPEWEAAKLLAKYPVQILIDKAGFTPKMIASWRPDGKEKLNQNHYGKFIIQQIEDGKLTKEDLIKWWEEYDNEIAEKNWHDPKFIFKQLDVTRLWNPYYPKDDSCVQALMREPAKIGRYVAPWHFSTKEREDFQVFLEDPANQEDLKKALKSLKGKIEKARPSFATGVANHIKSLIERCDYDDGNLEELLAKEYNSRNRTYYQGSNSIDNCEGSAVVGCILKAINELYGFEIYKTMYKDENDTWARPKIKTEVKGSPSADTLEGFLDDADHLKIEVKKHKASGKSSESGTVSNSSFHTYYNNDFEVIITKSGEEIYHKTFTNVCVGTSYYSGGWN